MGKMKEIHAKMTAKKQKSPMEKFTIMDFMKRFPTDESCLEFIKNKRWPDGIYCEKCEKVTGHSFTAIGRNRNVVFASGDFGRGLCSGSCGRWEGCVRSSFWR